MYVIFTNPLYMHRLPPNERSQFGTQRFLGHQINRRPKQICQIKLHPEVARGNGRPIELNQHIHIAACLRCMAHDGAEPKPGA